MPVNTDVTIPANSKTVVSTVGTSSGKRVIITDSNGAQRLIEVRVDPTDGTSAVLSYNITGDKSSPEVLYTTSADGSTNFGGRGKNSDGNVVVTSSAEALSSISNISIDGQSVTDPNTLVQEVVTTANTLSTSNGGSKLIDINPGSIQLTTVPGEAAESNNSGFSVTDVVDKVGNLVKNNNGIKQFVDLITLTDDEIQAFDSLFQDGSGDKIRNAIYPADNTYGKIRGQDYVTIDQFTYLPPRRSTLFGRDGNPTVNFTEGQQRTTPLKKFLAQVKLPMPNNITDSNSVAWGDDVMNNLSATMTAGFMKNPLLVGGLGIAGSLISPSVGRALALLASGGGGAEGAQRVAAAMASPQGQAQGAVNTGAAILGALGANVSPESIFARGFGVIPNSNVELLFNNVTLRSFQFSWRMSPRDEDEAKEVKKVIRFFKQGMAAKTMRNRAGERSLFLGTPNVFRLQYRTAGGEIIEGVNRIKPCAVVGTAVNYTPDGSWAAYDEGQPVSCTLSIQMKELEPVFASDYSENIIGSRRSNNRTTEEQFIGPFADPNRAVQDIGVGDGDLYPIKPTEVGY